MSKNIHLEANFWVQQQSTVVTEAKMVSCYLLPPSARPAFFFCTAPLQCACLPLFWTHPIDVPAFFQPF